MDDTKKFFSDSKKNIKLMNNDSKLKKLSWKWFVETFKYRYPYNFTWLGLPIIQYPHDLITLQEIIWDIKPKVIIETGIARGGSLLFYASMLKLLDNNGIVIGIDLELRKHNKKRILSNSISKNIKLIDGSSTDNSVVKQIRRYFTKKKKCLVILDSNHTHEHVLNELKIYSKFVSKNSFIIVFDTHCEFLPKKLIPNRPWGKGNSGYTAVMQFLNENKNFKLENIEDKTLISCAPFGFLKKVK